MITFAVGGNPLIYAYFLEYFPHAVLGLFILGFGMSTWRKLGH